MQKFSTNLCVVFGENCIAGMSVAWGRGVHAPLFYQILAGQLTLSQLRGQIMPTNYYMPPPRRFSDLPTSLHWMQQMHVCSSSTSKGFGKVLIASWHSKVTSSTSFSIPKALKKQEGPNISWNATKIIVLF